ncbi:sperm axonemal maintenance protein CFAP97D1-like [Saccostrea cucullata]|uniref:sperm axonemal maintenance protein CFAP97D1-like n=1 Tax=Saccostrea cuccullata TaxID=36930 RepID=UPI002ED614A7
MMHRAYQPLTPANNIYLRQRWDQEFYEEHRKKISLAKSVIDNNPPKTYMHLHIKLKKLQMEGERLAIVERDNRILLEKMAHIMRTGGRVDNRKEDYKQKSLNKTKRQRELLRITHENFAILKRLTAKEPHYHHMRWQDEWNINQRYMMNISKFPHYWKNKHLVPYEVHKEKIADANRRIRNRQEQHVNHKGSRPDASGSKGSVPMSNHSGLQSPQICVQSPSSPHVEDCIVKESG